MKLLRLTVICLCAFNVSPSEAGSENRVFACHVQDAVSWKSGLLDNSGIVQNYIGRSLLFDAASGLLRFWTDQPWEYEVIDRGSENDLVAVRVFHGPATTFVGLLRIRTWEKPMTFTYSDSNGHLAGICNPGN